jgi:hypothetical protein
MAVVDNKRRAVLFGLNYPNTDAELKGCYNDIENVRDLLIKLNVVPSDYIKLIKEPTGQVLIDEFHRLAIESHQQNLEYVFIHYSGHGGQVPDTSGDEKDCEDECLFPSDYDENGVLLDDDLHDLLQAFNKSTKVVVLIDACHSGSGLDLPYRYLSRKIYRLEHKCERSFPNCTMISGCTDEQTSEDAYDQKRKEPAGALTTAFIDSMETKGCQSDVFVLLSMMRSSLARNKFTQLPQLSTSFLIDPKKKEHTCVLPVVPLHVVPKKK